jgi:hypothetical protein
MNSTRLVGPVLVVAGAMAFGACVGGRESTVISTPLAGASEIGPGPTTVSPGVPEPEAPCPPFRHGRLDLAVSDVNDVTVTWRTEGGCPPFSGTVISWYQDELHPSEVYPIHARAGSLVDEPIIHASPWDRDYYLTLLDGGGQRIYIVRMVTIGG